MKRCAASGWLLAVLLMILAGCSNNSPASTSRSSGSTSNSSSNVQNINITIGDFYMRTKETDLLATTIYHFVVHNEGKRHQDFLIMHPEATQLLTRDQVSKKALSYIYDIAPNETKTLDFTFQHTAPKGMLELSCRFKGHYEAGMKKGIVVTAPVGENISAYPNNALP